MHVAHSKPERPEFMQTQYAFAGAIRDPESATPPADVAPRRMAIYQELFYNNINDFLSNAFPVLRKITSDDHWHTLMRDFLREHRARTPLFPEMPREFLHYLEQEREAREHDYPFMLELAHYEWVELALSISEESFDQTHLRRDGSPLDDIPRLSPLVWLCSYRFPVHRISPGFLPDAPGEAPTHLLVYRDHEDQVGFMELNPTSALLIERLKGNRGSSGETLLREMAGTLQHPNPKTVIGGGAELLEELQRRGIIGYRT